LNGQKLNELPPPPVGKSGWPWTGAMVQLTETMPCGYQWPRISIVTPSYNQGQFLEETIRSVLLQGYPNLEYIIIDGGSTDNSVEIIRKYQPWLTHWVSEKDRGQSHAINKGFACATGEILAWLNSDDVYEPGAFARSASILRQYSDLGFIYSDCIFVDAIGKPLLFAAAHQTDLQEMLLGNVISQPTVFYGASILASVGYLRDDLRYIMDYELWLRLMGRYSVLYVPGVSARFRMYQTTKTFAQEHRSWQEIITLFQNVRIPNVPLIHLAKALGLANLMAGLALLNVNQRSLANPYLRCASQLGLFRPSSAIFTAKRILAFLSTNQSIGRTLTEVEQLEMILRSGEEVPRGFWNTMYAIRAVQHAESSLKQGVTAEFRSCLIEAVRLKPTLLFNSTFFPLLWVALFGQSSMRFAVAAKRFGRAVLHARN
jgi:glycosyltransferase involved in cell wall biosynthesis